MCDCSSIRLQKIFFLRSIADKAWDADGQLYFDIFQDDGFLGDMITVNLAYKPYFEVERRKYRFRILNGSVARFFKIALSDGSPMIQIANDGNLLPSPVTLTQLDEQGIAERYDIVIDFSRYSIGQKVWMVNLAEHHDGKRASQGPLDCGGALGQLDGSRASANSWSSASSGIPPSPTSARCLPPSSRTRICPGFPWPRADLRVRPGRQPDKQRPGHGVHRPVGHRDGRRRPSSPRTSAGSRRRRDSAPARSGPEKRWRWLGSPDSHPLRGVPDSRPQRQSRAMSRRRSGPEGRLAAAARAAMSRSRCSSGTSPGCSWSTATTPRTRTTRCCCGGRSTTRARRSCDRCRLRSRRRRA